MSKPSGFKVLICGGGIAGLTLANCLQHADIDYLILEARDEIAPQVGASIGMFSHGGRILDQLGLFDDIRAETQPTDWMDTWIDGKLIGRKDSPQLLAKRTGYPISFGDRQMVLGIMFKHLRNKEKVLLGKRATQIDHSAKGVTVHCKDGTSYDGDVVVCADGVNSMARSEMWRNANLVQSTHFTEKEMTKMMSEYTCVYGISTACGLTPGDIELVYGKDVSMLVICGKDGRTFWFYFEKMDKKYYGPNIPKWTREDAIKQITSQSDFKVTDKVVLGDIWKTCVSFTLVSLEECLFDTWTWGRFACLGDSIHKMTPNIGQGGNSAIESAAALANSLKRMVSNAGPAMPSHAHIISSLQSYQKKRESRMKGIHNIANKMTRVEALRGFPERLLALYIAPAAGDFFTNLICDNTIGAEKVEYLPDTERSFLATMPFNPNKGIGLQPSILMRVLISCPLLLLGYCCYSYMQIGADQAGPQIVKALTTGVLPLTTTKLAPSYYSPLPIFDEVFRVLIALFAPALLDVDTPQRHQFISFLFDLAPLFLIWTFESCRRANAVAFARIPVIFGLVFQLFGIGSIGPLYYFLHYVQSPLSKFVSADQRMHTIHYAKTALPAMILAYLVPTYIMFYASTGESRLNWNAVWQPFPLLVAVTHYILANFTVADTTEADRLKDSPTTDLKHIRVAMGFMIVFAAGVFNYIRFTTPYSLATLFFPPTWSLSELQGLIADMDMVSGMNFILKVDHLSCFASSFIWLALLFGDLKSEEMVQSSWLKIISYAVAGTFIAGPGAVLAAGWWVREEMLASRHQKGAVTRPRRLEGY